MNREYHKWYSPRLQRDMELLVFGHAGLPMLVFPSSMGRFFEYEDRGMVAAIWHKIEACHFQLFCVDSVDSESWYNRWAHPRYRIERHMQYEGYVLHEVVPLIRQKNSSSSLAVTGCSFGGFHAVNFALRHPDLVTSCASMSGAFDVQGFLDGYFDEDCYFNCPMAFLPNMGDPWFLDRYRRNFYLLLTGEHDQCWDQNEKLAAHMRNKGVNHQLFVWGNQTGHDWPWWQQMARTYFQ
jgi:esterase/lipase superfamily enzyme